MHRITGVLSENTPTRRNRLLEACPRKLVLLAPSTGTIPSSFTNVSGDADRYEELLCGMQTLRGAVYLQDGAISSHELSDKRHRLDADHRSWHLLVIDADGSVCGCARYGEHLSAKFSQLSISRSALAKSSEWGSRLRSLVDAELAISERLGVPYVELGGWALDENVRCTSEALRLALSTYALSQALGGGVGISTATHRNSSSAILRRLGGAPFEHERCEVPAYFDHQYGCEMEVLRFYSWAPSPRYVNWIGDLKRELRNISVVANDSFDATWRIPQISAAARMPEPTVLSRNSRSFVV